MILALALTAGIGLTAASPNEATDDVLVSGHLTSADGVPVADATVELRAWPSPDVQAALTDDDTFELVTVGSTVTGKDGAYTMRLEPDADLTSFSSEPGIVDLELSAAAEGGYATYHFSVVPPELVEADESEAVQMNPTTGEVISSMRVDLRLDGQSQVVGADLPSAEDDGVVEDPQSDRSDNQGENGPDTEPAYASRCPNGEWSQVLDMGPRWVNVGSTFRWSSDVRMRVKVTSTGTSTLGVGFSLGRTAGYSQSGTVTRERGTSTTFPVSIDNQSRHNDTQYHYKKFCKVQLNERVIPIARFTVKAVGGWGGTRTRLTSTLSAGRCAPYSKGSQFAKTSTKAVTWTNGAKVKSGAIDINLSSRTGFTTSASLHVNFDPRAGTLCGRYGPPGGIGSDAPRWIVLR